MRGLYSKRATSTVLIKCGQDQAEAMGTWTPGHLHLCAHVKIELQTMLNVMETDLKPYESEHLLEKINQ